MREWRLDFPWAELSDDPLEQFLIAEAVMSRYDAEMQKEYERQEAHASARAKAKAMLGRDD